MQSRWASRPIRPQERTGQPQKPLDSITQENVRRRRNGVKQAASLCCACLRRDCAIFFCKSTDSLSVQMRRWQFPLAGSIASHLLAMVSRAPSHAHPGVAECTFGHDPHDRAPNGDHAMVTMRARIFGCLTALAAATLASSAWAGGITILNVVN